MVEEVSDQSIEIDQNPGGFVVKEIPEGILVMTKGNQDLADIFIRSKFWKEPENSFVGGGTRRGYVVEIKSGDRLIVKNKLSTNRMRELISSAEKSFSPKIDRDLPRILNSIEHEISAINEAKKRYKEAFGKELSTEDPLCGFIDKRGRKTIAFRYIPGELQELSQEFDKKRIDWESQTVQELESLGIHPYEAHAIVVKNDSSQSEGYHFVLVDAEKWTVDTKPILGTSL